MLFAISYDDSEVINNVSRQQPFQFIKQIVVINGVIDCTNIYCGSSKDLNGK